MEALSRLPVDNVVFPKLGIDLTINSEAISIFGFSVKWYGVMIALGMLLAMMYCFRRAKEYGIDGDRLIDAVIAGVIGAVVGARLYYVVLHSASYHSIKDILSIRDGGLAIYGGIIGGLLFGWAKPVPINPRYFRNPLKAMTITAAAGPLSNLLQMIFWALLLKALAAVGFYDKFVISVCAAGISVNLMLMAFNLIPIPPLDGGRIVRGLLPRQAGMAFDKIEPYGFMILLVLMVGGGLSFFVRPFLMFGQWIINLVL